MREERWEGEGGRERKEGRDRGVEMGRREGGTHIVCTHLSCFY